MKGKVLSAVLMSMVLLLACLAAGPVISGEHPWDSDRDGDGKLDGPIVATTSSDTTYYDLDSTTSEEVAGTVAEDPVTPDLWYSVYTSVVSAMFVAF